MPMYDYCCTGCGHEFEKIVTQYDTKMKVECPKCGQPSEFHIPAGSRSRVKFLFNYFGLSES